GQWMVQPRSAGLSTVSHDERVLSDSGLGHKVLDVGNGFIRGAGGGKAVIQGHCADIGNHVACYPAPDPYRIETLAKLQPVHSDGGGRVVTQRPQQRRRGMNGVTPFHDRALCAAFPGMWTSTRIVPLQPPSMT